VLYLVRHAKAGSRHNFVGDDKLRPLSPPGRRQAEAIGERLVKAGVQHFISSPSLRCIQTLRPAAKAIGAKVETDDRLFEGRSAAGVLELLATVPDETALSSHGDVIPETLDALVRRGCDITSIPDWRKGSVWVLERGSDGEIVSAAAWPPPDSAG
jgi:8-oxo-dGTP diphosphatase